MFTVNLACLLFSLFSLLLCLLQHIVVLLKTCDLLRCDDSSHDLNLTAEMFISGVRVCEAHSSCLNILCSVILSVILYMNTDIVCIDHK